MFSKKTLVIIGILVIAAFALTACAGETGPAGPAGPEGPAGPAGPEGHAGMAPPAADLTCTECHNEGTALYVASQQWAKSLHATGTAAAYAGARSGCTGCHSSEGFTDATEIGSMEEAAAPLVASQQNCRTCHQIHTSYTGADWALSTVEPVLLVANGETFDGGKGNLCASCHQPRRAMEPGVEGMFEITSTHWGPHHGPQSTMLLGQVGAGIEDNPGRHAMVEDTCVACHLGEAKDHDMGVNYATCAECHEDAEAMVEELQAEVQELTDEVGELLEAKGLTHDGHPNPGTYPEAEAQAAWNWIYIVLEDKSMGVHNPAYTIEMLEAALDVLR